MRSLFVVGAGLSCWLNGCTASSPTDEGTATLIATTENSSASATTAPTGPAGVARNAPLVRRHADFVAPYPKGRWRLGNPGDLGHVVLWVSQILIRHREVVPSIISFKGRAWPAAPAAPDRSRSEALRLARSVAEQAMSNPESFSKLVSEYSEDVASNQRGGSMGGLVAGHLIDSPQLLDALAAMQGGDTSQVVESAYGFHVLRLDSPPAEQTVSGARIVIGYDRAVWLAASAARGSAPSRSRSEALALATQLYERARKSPETFDRLIDEHSEHADAVLGGDMGTWSTREPAPIPREIEVLSRLEVGSIAPPLDSNLGIQIIKREPNPARDNLAMSSIRLSFQADVPERHPSSREAVLSQARLLSRLLSEDAGRFADLQAKHGSGAEAEQWVEGRGLPGVEVALRGLLPGQIAAEPVRMDSFNEYLIIKRVDPSGLAPLPAPRTLHELPAPTEPDVSYLISEEVSRSAAGQMLLELGEKAAALAGDKPEAAMQRSKFSELAKRLGKELLSTDVSSAFDLLMEETKVLLGDARFDEFRKWMNGKFESAMLESATHPP